MKYAFYLALFKVTLIIGLIGTEAVRGQQCDHISDNFERFENMRVAPPAKVTFIDNRTLDYVIQTRLQTKAGTFEITKETVVDKGIKKGDTVWLVYCIADNHLYVVLQLTPEQKKGLK